MLDKIVFSLLAFSLFIIIFFRSIKKDDSNYVILMVLQGLGIGINFLEIRAHVTAIPVIVCIRYLISVLLPILVLFIESKNVNFSEIIMVGAAHVMLFFHNNKGAKSILNKLTEKYPDSYSAHKLLAIIYEQEGGMRKAIDEYVMAIDLKKDDYISYFKIAQLLKDLGKKDESIEMLERLVRNKPDMYEASCTLGELLCEQERFKEAASVFEAALRFKPADYELYYNLGICYTRLNDFQMAKDMYECAASINHKLWGAKYNLGQLALIEKEYMLAEQYFKESLYDKDLEAMSYYQLARIYASKGERETAIEFLNKAIELNPKLLEKANKEKIFKDIKHLISVSVKMDEEPEEEKLPDDEEQIEQESVNIMLVQERNAQEYLEETNILIEDMTENTKAERIERTFNKENSINDIITDDRLQKLKESDEYQEMINSIDDEGKERTKTEDEDESNS